ncbi:MAG: gliding motility-associated C-terminal domain-containing protein, partial [Bacteroidetes bacterium]|nr:gliding motility-associated C-terminal domain-containing protein [Bacteroidota bacterium]
GSPSFTAFYNKPGIYTVHASAANSLGCSDTVSKTILVNALPTAAVTGDTTLIVGMGINIPMTYSSGTVAWSWTPADHLSCTDCASPYANPKFTTTYHVTITDSNNCVSSRTVTLITLCNNKNFFIPNTFSPNRDGVNDVFYPRGTGIDRIQALRIFNRWGELMYEKRLFPANDPTSGWDGTYKGKPANSDTYIYMIDIICDNATIITYKGDVTLIR